MEKPPAQSRPPDIQETLVMLRLHIATLGLAKLHWGTLLFSCLLLVNTTYRNPFPTHTLGLILIVLGAWKFTRHMPRGTDIQRRSKKLLITSLLLFYFLPFLQWWMQSPFNPYFAVNTLGFCLAGSAMLYQLNTLVLEFARVRNDAPLIQEANLGRVLALALPTPLLFVVIHSFIAHLRHGDPLLGIIVDGLYQTPLWLRLVLLIPFTTTLLSLYKARVHFESDIHLKAQRRPPRST